MQDTEDRRDARKEGYIKESDKKGGMQDLRDAGQDGCSTGRMQYRKYAEAGQEGYRKVGILDRWDSGPVGCRTRGIQDRREAGKEGCRKVAIKKEGMQERKEECRKGGMQERRDSGLEGFRT